MKRSTCAVVLGGLFLSLGCDQGTPGSDPVAGEADAPQAAKLAVVEPVPAGKAGGGAAWESLAGPLGDTREDALAAAEARLEELGERLAELMPVPGAEPPAGPAPWSELEERVDRIRRDVVRLGAAEETEWHSVKTDLEGSFAAIDTLLREVRAESPAG
jgi:hypothetical protein